MIRASARRLTPDPPPKVRTKKVRKVTINMEQVRKVLRVGGLFCCFNVSKRFNPGACGPNPVPLEGSPGGNTGGGQKNWLAPV